MGKRIVRCHFGASITKLPSHSTVRVDRIQTLDDFVPVSQPMRMNADMPTLVFISAPRHHASSLPGPPRVGSTSCTISSDKDEGAMMNLPPSRGRWSNFTANLLLLALALPAAAQEQAKADVVVVVDTSTSMREPGMDPERASLLVTKLLTDIVPGDLAVVRLLDLHSDEDVLPSRRTGETMPCSEDPTRTCNRVEEAINWEAAARSKKLGALVRPSRGDTGYKQQLERHLEQRANNSLFHLALRAGQGIFDEHRKAGGQSRDVPRTIIWLSDGTSDAPDAVREVLHELAAEGTVVEPIVFGRGDTALAKSAGLTPLQVS